MRHSSLRRGVTALAVVVAGLCWASTTAVLPALADMTGIAAKQRAEKKSFTDAEIIDGFLKTAFGAEYHLAGRVDRIRKYNTPVRIFVDAASRTDRQAQLTGVITEISRLVQHLDIAIADSRDESNVLIRLVRDRDLHRTIQSAYGVERARDIRDSLDPQCLSGFRKNEQFQIEHSEVILTVDNGDFTFLDCAYEEVLQSLGPINDTDSVPWTMFNDDVQMGFFDIYDQYLLNILYDPRVMPGMTVADVRGVLPAVLADVRVWVAKTNGLVK